MSGMFKPLQAEDIECRVAQVNKDNSVNVLLYKTARTDANILDDVIGERNWQCDYKEVNGVVYCGIGIKFDDEWIWKWDAGAETKVEQEKGQASDAFKRAGFKWGIGRELYYAPRIKIKADKSGAQDGKCFTPFEVDTIEYDEQGKITKLVIKHAWTDDILYQWYASQPNNAKDKFKPRDPNEKISMADAESIVRAYAGKDQKFMLLLEQYQVSDVRDLTASQGADIVRKLKLKGAIK